MKLDDIMNLIETDSVINQTDLSGESIKIPKLAYKYNRILIEEFKQLKGLDIERDRLKKWLYDYYLGYLSDDDYANRPLKRKCLKSEVDLYIDSDLLMLELRGKFEQQSLKVKVLEDFIKSVNNRSFMFKNIIEYEKFTNGGH